MKKVLSVQNSRRILFLIIYAILFFVIGLIVCNYFSKIIITTKNDKVITNPTQFPISNPSSTPPTILGGKVFKVTEQQRQEIVANFSPFGVSNDFSGIMIQNTSTDPNGLTQYYLGYDTSERNNVTLASLQSGSCVDLYVSEIKSGLVSGYFDRINLLAIELVQPRADLDCYLEFGSNTLQENIENKTITSQIYSSQRGAYDIAYDNVIKIPWGVAEALGYIDSSGRLKDPNAIAEIVITPANTAISKKIEMLKRGGKKTTLEGAFGWGYAETMTFSVMNILE